ncbi:SDR family NAD(P)-dependent oxidoreductase [Nocardioides mesophilus]|uniref:SDR family oxidoreductase n=1 Tax=Nocardioides mesophilus TaxID=433659 RepID=A0A7G9R9K5_9ACTN|nr:SDR family oxidoreductase [Nocardioides mesophilus]QNN52280.1 SDR family oxidoreductase [Nocardioides mesophilus]
MSNASVDVGAKVAVVTGAARGIGRAVGALLVERGYAVVLTDLSAEEVRRTAREIGAVAGVAQDVRLEESHAAVVAEATTYGRLAVWVNNAGVGDDGALTELSSEAVRRLVEVNLLGVIWGTRAALGAFGPGGGDVVNIASVSALGPVPGLSVYAATKAAVLSLSMSLAGETPAGVRVHAVCPDGVDTDLVAAMRPDGRAKAMVHSSGRLRTTAEVAAVAVDLVGRRRVVRTLPAWRSPLVRAGALIPSRSRTGFALFEAMGRRVMERSRRDA